MPELNIDSEPPASDRHVPNFTSGSDNVQPGYRTPPELAPEPESTWFHSTIWWGTAFELGLGLLAAVLAYFLSIDPWQHFSFGVLPIIGYVTGCLPLLIVLAFLLRSNWQSLRKLRQFVDTFVLPMFAGASVIELAILCAAAGFGEELLFRGVLQPIGVKYLGLYAGVLVINILFSLLHPFSAAYLALACLIGCYMSILYVSTNNLLAPMIVHGLYDFIALMWTMRMHRAAARHGKR